LQHKIHHFLEIDPKRMKKLLVFRIENKHTCSWDPLRIAFCEDEDKLFEEEDFDLASFFDNLI
jgi:hypothetical protein